MKKKFLFSLFTFVLIGTFTAFGNTTNSLTGTYEYTGLLSVYVNDDETVTTNTVTAVFTNSTVSLSIPGISVAGLNLGTVTINNVPCTNGVIKEGTIQTANVLGGFGQFPAYFYLGNFTSGTCELDIEIQQVPFKTVFVYFKN